MEIFPWLTVGVLSQDRVSCEDRLRLSLLVDGRDLKLVEVAGLEAGGGGAGGGAGAGSYPLPAVNVHVADKVAGDRGAAIILRRHPAQFDVFRTNLVRHQTTWLGGHVQDIHIAGGLEGTGLAREFDGVSAGVAGTIRLQ